MAVTNEMSRRTKLKKSKKLLLSLAIMALVLGGCAKPAEGFDKTKAITVVTREVGSGTRGAFIELLGIEQKDANGEMVDYTTDTAVIGNGQSVVSNNVSTNVYAIGYVSLGSLTDAVKAISVDGVTPTVEHINDGTYKIARPFNIATFGEVTEVAQDFISFILSSQGQAIVEENGYISTGNTGEFTSSMVAGKVATGGSTSVSPLMEKLKEAYELINPNVEIEVTSNGSTAGMTAALDGVVDIGMASRTLKDSELAAGLVNTVIAMDGIAMIVNNENPLEDITTDHVRAIYMGELTDWSTLFE